MPLFDGVNASDTIDTVTRYLLIVYKIETNKLLNVNIRVVFSTPKNGRWYMFEFLELRWFFFVWKLSEIWMGHIAKARYRNYTRKYWHCATETLFSLKSVSIRKVSINEGWNNIFLKQVQQHNFYILITATFYVCLTNSNVWCIKFRK